VFVGAGLEGDVSLTEAIDKARKASHHADGKCSMCAAGDEPVNGLHRGQYPCGNEQACLCCHNAGMEYGDQCAACGRIEKRKPIMGGSSPNSGLDCAPANQHDSPSGRKGEG